MAKDGLTNDVDLLFWGNGFCDDEDGIGIGDNGGGTGDKDEASVGVEIPYFRRFEELFPELGPSGGDNTEVVVEREDVLVTDADDRFVRLFIVLHDDGFDMMNFFGFDDDADVDAVAFILDLGHLGDGTRIFDEKIQTSIVLGIFLHS